MVSSTVSDDAPEKNSSQIMEQLTLGMVGDVVDERTFIIRDTSKRGNIKLRLGNVEPPSQGSLNDDSYAAKLATAKKELEALVGRQMVWWKAAPGGQEESSGVILGDAWLSDGKHVAGVLQAGGHLQAAAHYISEISGDILAAKTAKDRKAQYQKLADALKEDRGEPTVFHPSATGTAPPVDQPSPFGAAVWTGLFLMVVLVAVGCLMAASQKATGRGAASAEKKKIKAKKKYA